jgi:hypothetical protein
MADSRSSARRVRAAERRTQALDLRKQGKTFAEIGRELECSEQRAHAIVTAELQRLNARRSEQAAEVARLELERLDALLAAVWPTAKEGEGPAIDRVLAIMARRAKLQGLDAPDKRELFGSGGGPLRFALEDAVAATQELEEWERDNVQPGGGGEVPAGDDQVP